MDHAAAKLLSSLCVGSFDGCLVGAMSACEIQSLDATKICDAAGATMIDEPVTPFCNDVDLMFTWNWTHEAR